MRCVIARIREAWRLDFRGCVEDSVGAVIIALMIFVLFIIGGAL